MELTKIEEDLLREFNEFSYDQLADMFNKSPDMDDSFFWRMLDESLDMSAYIFSNLPRHGIDEDRVKRLVYAQANYLKNKYRQMS